MKKSELQQIIKEELINVLKEKKQLNEIYASDIEDAIYIDLVSEMRVTIDLSGIFDELFRVLKSPKPELKKLQKIWRGSPYSDESDKAEIEIGKIENKIKNEIRMKLTAMAKTFEKDVLNMAEDVYKKYNK